MINLTSESLLSFAEAAKRLPSRPNLSTLHRWRFAGVRGVKLETCLIGGKRYTSIEALERFSCRLTDGELPHASRTLSTSRRAIKDAESRLDSAGVLPK